MPGLLLPTLSVADVRSHDSDKSCYVTIGSKVYDVTDFLNNHPGGDDLILDYAGQDVAKIMDDEVSHSHSEAAYEILEEHLVGFVATEKIMGGETAIRQASMKEKPVYATTGMSSADDLSVDTDSTIDYKTHKFIDLNRPMLMQMWNGGFSKKFYLEQVHRPRHYKGGESAPLFGNFLEPLSKTPWYVVPMCWLPLVAYGTSLGFQNLEASHVVAYWFGGLAMWTLVEYILHRGLFHVDEYLPDNRVGITAHFLLHGIHHYLPMDKLRLVMPPTLFVVLATPFWKLAHTLIFHDWYAATTLYCGGIFGYICYDLTHYFLHHRNLPLYYRELKRYHLQHHFADYENGFGVTSRFWDRIFGTELPPLKPAKAV